MKHHTIRVSLATIPFLVALPACNEKSSTPAPAKSAEKQAAPAAESAQKAVDAAAAKAAEKSAGGAAKQP